MVRVQKQAFSCIAFDNTENKEKVIVDLEILLAVDEAAVRQEFTISHADKLAAVAKGEVRIVVSPFCRS